MSERWCPVVAYEGLYEVSDLGRVRSLDRVVRPARGASYLVSGRLLAPQLCSGYLNVFLCREGVVKRFAIHALVLSAFIGPCPPGMEACHGPDPTRTNCRLDNLRWDSKRKNQIDRLAQGARDFRGSTNGNARLIEGDVERIHDLRRHGATQKRISEWIGTSEANVCLIVRGKAWTHVASRVA